MIIRTQKTQNYSIIANECFKDPTISARAKGIYAYIMTLPDNWKLSKKELYRHFSEGQKAIDSSEAQYFYGTLKNIFTAEQSA